MSLWKFETENKACTSEYEKKIKKLEQELKEKDREIIELKEKLNDQYVTFKFFSQLDPDVKFPREAVFKLSHEEIQRYGRQLILPEIGIRGKFKFCQLCLANESVLIVGAGGLGCPAAVYLAAAGVGYLGLIDYDEVEMNNLHRQILHTESRIGLSKTQSIAEIVDATDNVATRYLVNDACVFNKKPLVSGSALKFEGQLTVYNYKNGPCYRCLYPVPPPPKTVGNCSDAGVLGVIPGIIGCLQALEVIKISTRAAADGIYTQRLLAFDGRFGTFRDIKLRPRQPNCVVCGDSPSVTDLIDYEQFCGASADDKEYSDILAEKKEHLLIDVRLVVEQDICSFRNAINIPFGKIEDEESINIIESNLQKKNCPVYVICRNGNDSQEAVQMLRQQLADSLTIKDIIGGTNTWAREIDSTFPCY
ncbi:Adenylyltransferase and sulfurtransferase MOCS3 [Nymphon striatum]|nr:Adenylyltransferase and sulfurtransferase MOCS3 [Nymphon striatum]